MSNCARASLREVALVYAPAIDMLRFVALLTLCDVHLPRFESGPVPARASEPAGATGSVSECEPMQLTISGQTQTSLLGGALVVAPAQALLGVSLR
jgi:hypothetical protein